MAKRLPKPTTQYAGRRVLRALALLLALTVVTFVSFHLLPRRGALGGGYADYLQRLVLHLDLGYSHIRGLPVRTLILRDLPPTVWLGLGGLVIGAVVGTGIGLLRRGSRALTGVISAVPPYWLGLISLYLFSRDVGRFALLPGAGTYAPLTHSPGDWFTSLLMPWLVLGTSATAIWASRFRGGFAEAMDGEVVLAARARGIPERAILVSYGVRSGLRRVARGSRVGLMALVGLTLLVEVPFRIPGIGGLLADSIRRGDLAAIQGSVVCLGALLIMAELVADLLRAARDGGRG